MQKRKNKININNFYLIAILIASVFMCIGYASVNNIILDLAGTAGIKGKSATLYIYDADIDANSNANVSASSISLFYETMLQSKVVLNNNVDSTLSMEITIKNDTDNNAYFEEVVYGNNFYDNNNIDFTLTGLTTNQLLAAHGSVTFTITFKYTDAYKATNPQTFTNELNSYLNFKFGAGNYVARIGTNYYTTLQNAVNNAPNNTQTTIVILKDVTEHVTIGANKNVALNIGNYTIHNSGKQPIFELASGSTLTISDGTISSDTSQGAINVVGGATLYVTGGTITNTGTRQAIYNNGGTTYISGSATLSNNNNERAPVHNLNNGTLYITGGTITAGQFSGVYNASGTVTIGTKDGNYSASTPIIQGATYGVDADDDINYYDGVIKGHTSAFDNETFVVDKETGLDIVHSYQTINGLRYDVAKLGQSAVVTFDANGGNSSEVSRTVEVGLAIGFLPTPTRTNHEFLGWFTDPDTGTEITSSYVVTGPVILYAHWLDLTQIKFAKVGDTEYLTFADAWSAATASNTPATIQLLRNNTLTAKHTVANSRNVTIDLAGYKIDYYSGSVFEVSNGGTLQIKDTGSGGILEGGRQNGNKFEQVIVVKSGGHVVISSGTVQSSTSQIMDNSGTVDITGGTIKFTGNVNQGLINNNNGATINISGGTIINTYNIEKGQAVYNKGTANISGSAVLSSNSYDRATVQNDANKAVINISGGTISSVNANCSKGAVQNINNATVVITGGTITSASTNSAAGAVQNAGSLTIGAKDGTINTSTPTLQGAYYGVNNSKTFNFYDGTIKGIQGAYNGTPSDIETNSQVISGTETISGQTYQTAHLE